MKRHHRLLVAAGLIAPACAPAHTAHRARSSAPSPSAEPHPAAQGADAAEPGTGEAPLPRRPGPASTTTTAPVLIVSGLPAATDGTTTTRVRPRPTTTLPENVDADVSDATWWENQPGYQSATREALLACIRRYEQGAAGYATDTGNGYYGAYQANQGTWDGIWRRHGRPDLVGTNPAHASPRVQDQFALHLLDERGLQPWPTPSRRCK